jgi:hypothetical protein
MIFLVYILETDHLYKKVDILRTGLEVSNCYLHPPNCGFYYDLFVDKLVHHRFCKAVPSSYKKVSLQIYKHACMDGFRSLV